MFFIIELLFILLLVYLIGNIFRFFFLKGEKMGGFFALSDQWLKQDNKKQQQQQPKEPPSKRRVRLDESEDVK
jgi:uncharacterized membrane protein YraQ (UPF0718 family)